MPDDFDRTRLIAAMVALQAWADLEDAVGRCPGCRASLCFGGSGLCAEHRPEMEIAQSVRGGILESWRPEYRACFEARTAVVEIAIVAALLAARAAELRLPLAAESLGGLRVAVARLGIAQAALNAVPGNA